MGQSQTFDASSFDSIAEFANRLTKLDDKNIDDEFLIVNVKKAINALKETKEKKYDDKKTKRLLLLMQNIAFFCRSEKVIDEIIKEDLHAVYQTLLDYYLKQQTLDYKCLLRIFGSLASLTVYSVLIAKENIKWNFNAKAINLLEQIDIANVVKSNNDESLGLYCMLINFILKTSFYRDLRDALVGISIIERLEGQSKKIDALIDQKGELRYVRADLATIIANLLNDNQLDTLPISQQIVDILLDILKEILEKAGTNERLLENTKYYTFYTINLVQTYIYVSKHLSKIISIAVNDTIKQKLYKGGILPMLTELLKNGNEVEIEKCTELLCSLCFDSAVSKYVKDNTVILEQVKHIQEDTGSNSTTKQACKQTVQMVSSGLLEKEEAHDGKHIMISYNHTYKDVCIKINEELKKRGFLTWMDVEAAFNDLQDAMADAVENASIVLVCYSHQYKNSNNCRLEAQYSNKLKKDMIAVRVQPDYDPDGWLGLILASKLYVDFSTNVDSMQFNDLLKQINALSAKASNRNNSSFSVATSAAKSPSDWDSEDVVNWLKTNNMNTLANVFKNWTGLTLKSSFEMKQRDYTLFCNTIEKEIQKAEVTVDAMETLNFYQLLENLFKN